MYVCILEKWFPLQGERVLSLDNRLVSITNHFSCPLIRIKENFISSHFIFMTKILTDTCFSLNFTGKSSPSTSTLIINGSRENDNSYNNMTQIYLPACSIKMGGFGVFAGIRECDSNLHIQLLHTTPRLIHIQPFTSQD